MAEPKELQIQRLLASPVVDLWKLREHALTEGGLLNGESRVYSLVFFCAWMDGCVVCLFVCVDK